jgi:organic radical activating enzyme
LPATADGPSLLEVCRELAYRMLAHCNFCPWNCRVDRMVGAKFGACKLASASRVSSYFHHTGEELFFRGTEGSGTIFFTSCNMRCAFCQNGDISTDKDNGEETDPRTLAAMAWTLRREGCHNINWVGGEVVIHLHAIVDAIALLGRDFTPTQAELRRALRTKADRLFWFDLAPGKAIYEGKFNAPMLWNSNFFMTLESMKILRVLTDVLAARLQIRARPMRNGASEDALVLGDGNQEPRTHRRVGRRLFDPPLGDAQSCRVLYLPSAGMDCRARPCGTGERDGAVPSRQFLRSCKQQVPR